MRVTRSVLIFTALAILLSGCGKGSGQTGSLTIQLPEHAKVWRWQVVKAGSPDQVVQSVTAGTRTVTVPPGNYQLTIQQDEYFSGRVVWPQTIRVKRNQQATVSIQSGVTLQVPEKIQLWRWRVVKAGLPEEVVQWTKGNLKTLLVPPGDYQVTIQQDEYFSGQVIWPTPVRVEPDRQTTVAVQSGITLETPEKIQLWRWRVVKAGLPEEVVQWTKGNLKTLLVPPGDYQVTIQQDEYFSGQVIWPTPVRVEPDRQTTVAVQSGITLETPEKIQLWRWRVVKAGLPEEVVQWTKGNLKTLLVPPGDYQVTIQQDEYFSGQVIWPTPVRVEPDRQTTVAVQSGVKLTVRAKARIWRWQVVKAGLPEEVVQWTTSNTRTLLVPPGDYQIVIKPEEHQSATVVWPRTGSLAVLDGQLAQALIDLLTPDNAETSGSDAQPSG